ncbi:MAG: DUF4115 domain-containing protein [Elusimicrobia bacterium]|nr:DUF4115 domain-containing protein [Elusimicrobiota bacterium]
MPEEPALKEAAAPAPIGKQLRERRLERGLTLEKIRDDTKIPTKYIIALEEGRHDVFPARVYLRGFFLTYVKYLVIGNPMELWETHFEKAAASEGKALLPDKDGRSAGRQTFDDAKTAAAKTAGPWESFILWAMEGQNWILAFFVLPAFLISGFYGIYSYIQHQNYRLSPSKAVDVQRVIGQPVLPAPGSRSEAFSGANSPVLSREFHFELATKSEPTWLRVDIDERRAYEGVLPALQKRMFRVKSSAKIRVGNPRTIEVRLNGSPWLFSSEELDKTPLEKQFTRDLIETKIEPNAGNP